MYNLASTAKQSVLDLINQSNGTEFTLTDVALAAPADVSATGFVAQLSTTNSVVRMSDASDNTDYVDIGYHRLDAETAFGETPTVGVVLANSSNSDVIGAVLTHMVKVWGMPMDAGTYTATRNGGTVTVAFNSHHVVRSTVDITLKELIAIGTIINTKSTSDHFTSEDKSSASTSAEALLALINQVNGTTLTFSDVSFSKPSAIGGAPTPHDSVTITGLEAAGYGDKTSFNYDRLNIEDLSPNGVDLEDFASFTAFYNAVTSAYMAGILTQLYGVPVLASELKVRSQSNNGDNFTAKVSIVDNYILRSSAGITVTSKKTTS